MKNIIFSFLILFTSVCFAGGNTTQQPASQQRILNASFTCPTGKWCDVTVNVGSVIYSVITSTTLTTALSTTAGARTERIILKSGEVLSGVITAISGTACSGNSNIVVSIGGVGIIRTASSLSNATYGVGTITCATTTINNYAFFSNEYYN